MLKTRILMLLILLAMLAGSVQAGGGQGSPIYLDVTVTLSPAIVAQYNPPPSDLSQVTEVQNVINTLTLNGWGLVSMTGNLTPSGGAVITMRWVDYMLQNPDLPATQQGLASAYIKGVGIRAVLSGELFNAAIQ